MSSFRSPSSNQGTQSSSQKKPSFFIRFVKSAFFQMFVFFVTIILLGVWYAAWTTLDRNDAADGKPVTQTLMQGIIDNINDLHTRLTVVNPTGTTLSGSSICIGTKCKTTWTTETTGGTITWPIRWSSIYTNNTYEQAWVTCLTLAPAGSWRVPSENDIELGRHKTPSLFPAWTRFWSTSWDDYDSGNNGFDKTMTWQTGDTWQEWEDPDLDSALAVRCVSDL